MHTVLRYAKFLANNSLAITLLVQIHYFMPVKLWYLAFYIESSEEMGTNYFNK